jgi:hypothetical protein
MRDGLREIAHGFIAFVHQPTGQVCGFPCELVHAA